MGTELSKQQRNQKLTALEDKRRRLEVEWLSLNQHDQSLGKRDLQRRSELRELLDQLNSLIVEAIVDESK